LISEARGKKRFEKEEKEIRNTGSSEFRKQNVCV
jgi:hypothetical protein